jgi:hypothetical protein
LKPATTKLVTASVATAIAIAGAAWYLRATRAPLVRLVDRGAQAELLLLARQLAPRGLPAIQLSADTDAPLAREPLSEETVRRLFPLQSFLVYDPHSYFRYAGGLDMPVRLPDYPGGGFRRRTNSAGEREDHETSAERPDLLVLATGDSHTDGICTNPESWPNRVEAALLAARPGRTVEVLNAAVQGFSFYNYLGVLEKYAPRKPAAFVVAVYAGNDFLESLQIHHYFAKTVPPPRSQAYFEELQRLERIGPAAAAQGVDELLYFKHYPEEIEVALDAGVRVGAEIDRQCRAAGIPWIVLYIPSIFDEDLAEGRELGARVREAMGFSEADLRRLGPVGDRLLERYRSFGIEVLDLREVFRAEPGPWYASDLHIDLLAQARIAALVAPSVERALAAGSDAGR